MTEYSTCTVGIDLGDRKSVACIYSPGEDKKYEPPIPAVYHPPSSSRR